MCYQMAVENDYSKQEVNNQVYARGWQDYMMETLYFIDDRRVVDCLKSLDVPQLAKLGLSNSDMLSLHKPALVKETELVKIAA